MSTTVRAGLDAAVALLSRAVARVFFRQVEVFDAERVPRGQPLLVVANHENNIVDPLLLAGFLGVRPRFLAKSTLWSHPVVAPLLLVAGALPVYRRQDPGANVARNRDTFARCHEELSLGAAVALFPEGTSHNRPHRLPLKTGAARIALEAEARRGPLGLRILPVGLVYEDKSRFRSRVIVQVGPPLDPGPETALYRAEPRTAVHVLTARISDALAEVTLNHASWEEARLVGRASALLAEPPAGRAPTFAEVWPIRQRVWRTYRELRREDQPSAEWFAREVGRYEQALRERGLSAEDVPRAGTSSTAPALRWTWVALLLAAAPLAGAGVVLNVVPYRFIDWIAGHATRTPDQPATYKVLGALIFLPLAWTAQAACAWAVFGRTPGLATGLAAPLAGYVALLWIERFRDVRARVRRRLAARGPGVPALAEQRARLSASMRELIEERNGPSRRHPQERGGSSPATPPNSGGYSTSPSTPSSAPGTSSRSMNAPGETGKGTRMPDPAASLNPKRG
jgi:1-acyl-sn-glycerol-3-phosphate acyltransferase